MSDLIQIGVAFVFGLGVGMIAAWVAREERRAEAWGKHLGEQTVHHDHSFYDWSEEPEHKVHRDVRIWKK